MQRIKMNRPFLHARIGESWGVCFRAARELLAPYRRMREVNPDRFRRSQKLVIQGYQSYTAAVTIAAFLLVERSLPGFSSEYMRQDVDMVISDLELQADYLGPLVADGIKILRKMLLMFDHPRTTMGGGDRESLVHDIASVFGGERPTRRYLKQSEPQQHDSSLDHVNPASCGTSISSISASAAATTASRDSVESSLTVPSPPSLVQRQHEQQWTGIQYAPSSSIPTLIDQKQYPMPAAVIDQKQQPKMIQPYNNNHHLQVVGNENNNHHPAAMLPSPYNNNNNAAGDDYFFMTDDQHLHLALDMLDYEQWWPVDFDFTAAAAASPEDVGVGVGNGSFLMGDTSASASA